VGRANSGDRHCQTAVSRKRDQPVMPAGTDGNNKTQDWEQGRRRTANLVIKRPIVRCVRCGWRCVVGPQCLENVGARQDRTTTNKAVCLIVCMRYQKHLLCIYIIFGGVATCMWRRVWRNWRSHRAHGGSGMTWTSFRRWCTWLSRVEATEPGWKGSAGVLTHGFTGVML
jgi:hypothetical protein